MPSTTRSGRYVLMKDRSDTELDKTIQNAHEIGKAIQDGLSLTVNPFWELCAGVDAYFEKRRRKLGGMAYGHVETEDGS